MSSTHSRTVSSDTTSSQSSGYHFILEHILSYPGTYGDVPLRSMYALNCSAMTRSLAGTTTPPSQTTESPVVPTSPAGDNRIAMRTLMGNLVSEFSKGNNRKDSSLPPSFITSFLHKVFPIQLECVDFPQALTALDYLKDLETRRRKEQAHALKHLGIDRSVLEHTDNPEDLARWYPEVAEFVCDLPRKEKRADVLYTQLYVALRRWILINEMMLDSFNRSNCHAMLNTLYPPTVETAPTSKLTVNMLMQQREGFFRYIKTVENRGTHCLATLMKQGAKNGESNGWAAVKRTLNNYLSLANSMIEDCQYFSTLEPASSAPEILTMEEISVTKRDLAKTDSGISFGAEGKHSKSPSTSSGKSMASHASFISTTSVKSQGSTLERIARELKRMRPRRLQADEIINTKLTVMPKTLEVDEGTHNIPLTSKSDKENYLEQIPFTPNVSTSPKSVGSRLGALRKMRSLGALGELKHSNLSVSSLRSQVPPFDPAYMRRQRVVFEQRRTNNEVSVVGV